MFRVFQGLPRPRVLARYSCLSHDDYPYVELPLHGLGDCAAVITTFQNKVEKSCFV
jgi:hypothetical protein